MATKLINKEDEIDPLTTTPKLKLITGGKDGGEFGSNGPDWLRDLPVGSAFFAQDKQNQNNRDDKYFSLAGPFSIAYRTPNERGVGLVVERAQGTQALIPVDSLRFCTRYSLFDILNFGDGKPITKDELVTEEPEGDTNGNSEGTLQS